MTGGGAGEAQADPSNGQIHIIMDNHRLGWTDFVKLRHRLDTAATVIHECLRLKEPAAGEFRDHPMPALFFAEGDAKSAG